jgi:hypothetical protein
MSAGEHKPGGVSGPPHHGAGAVSCGSPVRTNTADAVSKDPSDIHPMHPLPTAVFGQSRLRNEKRVM